MHRIPPRRGALATYRNSDRGGSGSKNAVGESKYGSILKFVEDQFGLTRLASSERARNRPGPYCFDFKAPPRKFTPISAPYDRRHFQTQPLDLRPPDSD